MRTFVEGEALVRKSKTWNPKSRDDPSMIGDCDEKDVFQMIVNIFSGTVNVFRFRYKMR